MGGIHSVKEEGASSVSLSSPVEEQAQILLQVTALTKRYVDQVALADIALTVRAGEILGLIGPNGAGKTTLLEALAWPAPAATTASRRPLLSARRSTSL